MSDRFERQQVATADDVQHQEAAAGGRQNARRQLESSVSWTTSERLRCYWLRVRLTVAEMNDASQRLVELQAPWASDGAHAGRAGC